MWILFVLGLVLFLIGWIWLIIIAGKTASWPWAIVVFIFGGLVGGFVFCVVKKRGWPAWAITALGLGVLTLNTALFSPTGSRLQ